MNVAPSHSGTRRKHLTITAVAVATLGTGFSFNLPGAMAQVGSVMQIPVPAPQQAGRAPQNDSSRSGPAPLVPPASVAPSRDVLIGKPLAMPEATVPLGSWAGRSGVKEIALAEMPWMGGGGYSVAWASSFQAPFQPQAQAQYRVVVETPSETHADVLKRFIPEAIALTGGDMMQAGAFADWRRANALQRALGAYGFLVQVQGL